MTGRVVRVSAWVLVLGVGTLAGCSTSSSNELANERRASARTRGVQISEHAWHDPAKRLSTVNGQTPPGLPTFAKEQSDAIRTTDTHRNIVLTHLTVRAPGTRSPVHVHEHGGTTCLMQGEMTCTSRERNRNEPSPASATTCREGGRAMSGLNAGAADAVMVRLVRHSEARA